MKYLTTLGAASALVNSVAGHYIWTQLDVNGQSGVGTAGGIRPNTNYNSPVTGE
jgi:acyl-coenzyme A thioesterase PaaI-like protein